MADPPSLRNRTFTLEAGATIPVTYIRGGAEQTAMVSVAEMPADLVLAYFGFSVKDDPGDPRGGVVVDRVVEGTPAARSGLKPDLRIVGIGPRRFASKAEFDGLITPLFGSPEIPLGVVRDGRVEFLPLAAPSADRP